MRFIDVVGGDAEIAGTAFDHREDGGDYTPDGRHLAAIAIASVQEARVRSAA